MSQAAADRPPSLEALISAWRWGYDYGRDEALQECTCHARELTTGELRARRGARDARRRQIHLVNGGQA